MRTTEENARKREIILKCLKAGVEPDSAIAARAGCAKSTVQRVRAELAGKPRRSRRGKKR